MNKKTHSSKKVVGSEAKTLQRVVIASEMEIILPPKHPRPLAEITAQIEHVRARITHRTHDYHNIVIYDMVEEGLFYLKVQAHFAFSDELRLGENNSPRRKARARGERGRLAKGGVYEWIRTVACQGSFESEKQKHCCFEARKQLFYQRIKMAVAAGLTSDSTIKDVEALRTEKKLHGLKPTDLSKRSLLLNGAASASPAPPSPPLYESVQLDLFAALDQAIQTRDSAPPDQYEATVLRLKSTLEHYTGQAWMPADGHGAELLVEHGEMSHARR